MLTEEIITKLQNFKGRPSAMGTLMTEPKGDTNKEKYDKAVVLFNKLKAEWELIPDTQLKRKENKLKKVREANNSVLELEKLKDKITLSESCIAYLHRWVKATMFNRRASLKNKFVVKGLAVEEDSITLLTIVLKLGFIKKNEVRACNEFIDGECDLNLPDIIRDVKSSWDLWTFPMFETEIPTIGYWWQGQCYMWLYEKFKYAIDYCLINTPEYLIEREMRIARDEVGGSDYWTKELENEMRRNMTFDDIPNEKRVKSFYFDRDEEAIERIKERVLACREYINENILPNILKEQEIY